MNKTSFTFIKGLGDSLRDTFFLPGDLLASTVSPVLEIMGSSNEFLVSAFTSTLVWLSLLVGVWKLVQFALRIARRISVTVRARLFLLKKRLPRQNGLRISYESAGRSEPDTEVAFDDLDLAVLSSAATLNPGFALSAPDLATTLKSQPKRVQSSLEKLAINMMLERALGSTDDYDNYRLTRAGAAFLSMWQRNEV